MPLIRIFFRPLIQSSELCTQYAATYLPCLSRYQSISLTGFFLGFQLFVGIVVVGMASNFGPSTKAEKIHPFSHHSHRASRRRQENSTVVNNASDTLTCSYASDILLFILSHSPVQWHSAVHSSSGLTHLHRPYGFMFMRRHVHFNCHTLLSKRLWFFGKKYYITHT